MISFFVNNIRYKMYFYNILEEAKKVSSKSKQYKKFLTYIVRVLKHFKRLL